jgi:hypothetical protein
MAPPLGAAGLLTIPIALAAFAAAVPTAAALQRRGPQVLQPSAALPAHIAGSFQELSACQQSSRGEYFIFDRRSHSVFTAPAGLDTARKLIEIGVEPGRVLGPTAFDLAPDDTFAVADVPYGKPRIQMFMPSGASLGGFYVHGRAVGRVMLKNSTLNGLAALEYTGRSIFISQPENGGLITEYALDGRPLRTFGALRRTGHEGDEDVHFALNSGLVKLGPEGEIYFVFLAGSPQFRKYDANGALAFERTIQGSEIDGFVQSLPTTWKREPSGVPLVLPTVYAAGVAPQGDLWISLAVGSTYVYDGSGERRRVVQFRATGALAPVSLSFMRDGRVLVTPGCYVFQP